MGITTTFLRSNLELMFKGIKMKGQALAIQLGL